MIENNDKLKEIIVRIIETDIKRSLSIDNKLERTWMWWRRVELITERNELLLENIIETLNKI